MKFKSILSFIVIILYVIISSYFVFFGEIDKSFAFGFIIAVVLISLNYEKFESFELFALKAKLQKNIEEAYASKEEFDKLSKDLTEEANKLREDISNKTKNLEQEIQRVEALSIVLN